MAMLQRVQFGVILLLAVAMLVIFISPAVPAPTTLRSRHSVTMVHLAPYVPVLEVVRTAVWQPVREALVIAHSPDVLDLTSARLC